MATRRIPLVGESKFRDERFGQGSLIHNPVERPVDKAVDKLGKSVIVTNIDRLA